MKKVVVTGADGFIGSHLTELLVREGFEVKALAYYNSFNTWGWLDRSPVLKDIEVVSGDVRDPFFCRKLVNGVDAIFHLAALIAIPYSYVAPQSYIETNINGTINICQAALDSGALVVQTSTSEVYGTAQYVPIDEEHPLQPQSPYSASKIGSDMMALSYFNAFSLPVTVARPFNTYGPRQSARAVIPNIISQVSAGKKSVLLGDLTPTRDFNYVEDTCRGLLALAKCGSAVGQVTNIGSNFEISIKDLVHKIASLMGREIHVESDEARLRPEKSEVFRLWCDNGKIKELTGFQPLVGLDEGLKRTIEWFAEPKNLAVYKTDIYNV
jgi:NAD dependent epimerase/dehydratase